MPPSNTSWPAYLRVFFSGLLLPLGFAPFHMPGLAFLSLAILFVHLHTRSVKPAFLMGFAFAIGALGFGVSWVYVSIHHYGHLHAALAACLTLLFVLFFSLYTGLMAGIYTKLSQSLPAYACAFLFASLWFFSEYLRARCVTGFPWLLIGFGQMDSPLQHLLPVVGVFGVGWITALASAFLGLMALEKQRKKQYLWLTLFVMLILTPLSLKHQTWTQTDEQPVSVGIIQANLSMRDKWDETLYSDLTRHYQETAHHLMQDKQLVVMPESAIPLPSSYAGDFLDELHEQAKLEKSAVLLGIPHPNEANDGHYHNALLGLGDAQGVYLKQHLVPFGEYIPAPFLSINRWLNLPEPALVPGHAKQTPVTLNDHRIATLICYELAYPALLRAQLPEAAWIVSISDDGWFGHSFAIYQHIQMAQALSKQTGRFQVLSNNDGLSSLINAKGQITDTLPAFSAGVLEGKIHPAEGASPWVRLGDIPVLFINTLVLLFIIGFQWILAASKQRRYPNQLR